jgi:hypothetical protein
MYCTITVGLLLSNVSVASLPCSSFDQIAVVEERDQIAIVEERKVQLVSLDHSYVPLPPSQPNKSEIKIGTTTINLEQSNIKNMSIPGADSIRSTLTLYFANPPSPISPSCKARASLRVVPLWAAL